MNPGRRLGARCLDWIRLSLVRARILKERNDCLETMIYVVESSYMYDMLKCSNYHL